MSSRVAVVTGSGRKRVGSVVADALAGRGHAVAVHYRSSAAEAAKTVAALRRHGVEAAPFPADLTDERAAAFDAGGSGGTLDPHGTRHDGRALPRSTDGAGGGGG
jgi:NAD(P)-dependent dehydrogenase (short-subunit alcohol dehydrogenase family)